MNLEMLGSNTSTNKITHITQTGLWLIAGEQTYFIPFSDYPAFQQATIAQIFAMQSLSPEQFHWPELDIDIELDALKHPEQYPLAFQ